ncbi:MAG: DDE-type integrase/transposase/recombinase [Candidatus Caldarchaeum sp.]
MYSRRGPIAVDETVIHNLVRRAYLWAAREVMAVQVSRVRGIAECIRFLEVVRDRCANNPTVYMDRAPWYGWPMKVLGFRRRVETFGKRNTIESWFSKLKRRIKQFNTCFPTYSPKVSEKWIRSWMTLS